MGVVPRPTSVMAPSKCQNARLRIAIPTLNSPCSRVLPSREAVGPKPEASALEVSREGSSPSGRRPWDSGRSRMVAIMGNPNAHASAVTATSAPRQPYWLTSHAIASAHSPPSPVPTVSSANARLRNRTNQRATATAPMLGLQRLFPAAMKINAETRAIGVSARLNQRNPKPHEPHT